MLLYNTQFLYLLLQPFFQAIYWWVNEVCLFAVIIFLCVYIRSLLIKLETQRVLNYFATSLYGMNTVEDVFWDIAINCISKLQLRDCIIYLYDDERKVLVQVAAYGNKNPVKREILSPIEIPLGKGIVGTVAITGKAEVIKDTSKDSRYIIDDERRFSEITVPVFLDNKVFGIIDSEHSRKNYFKQKHLHLLSEIALICSEKISKYLLEEKLRSNIARDLHDEIGSTLTSINILSKIAIEESGSEKGGNYLPRIKTYSADILERMSDIVWAINPANDHMENIMLRMKIFATEILEPLKINVVFKEDDDIADIKLPLSKRKDFYLVFKEAITNIAKFGKASEVRISVRKQGQHVHLFICNNGESFDTNISYNGNGLQNMQQRARQMNASIQIDPIQNGGTKINLLVPIT